MKKVGEKFKESWERTKEKADQMIHPKKAHNKENLAHRDTVDTKDKLNPKESLYTKTDNDVTTNESAFHDAGDTKAKKPSHHGKHLN